MQFAISTVENVRRCDCARHCATQVAIVGSMSFLISAGDDHDHYYFRLRMRMIISISR